MFPIVEIFGREIGSYQIMAIAGILVAGFYACRAASKRGHDDNLMIQLLAITAAGVFFGGHILFGLTNSRYFPYLVRALQEGAFVRAGRMFLILFGGSVFYGGLLGGLLTGFICMKKMKLDVPMYTDVLAPVIPLFHFFGRIGCFLGGCCYGVESSVGFVFTDSLVETANHVRRLPIQLIEAGFNMLLFLLLAYLLKKAYLQGRLLMLYLLLYPVIRFILEFWRGDVGRGFIFGLSTSQFISMCLFVVIGIQWIILQKRRREV